MIGGDKFKRLSVPSMTFTELCEKYQLQHINLLQVDTEGYDSKIIRSIDFTKVKIDMIIYENWDFPIHRFTRYGEGMYDMGVAGMKKLKIFLEKLGYKVERLDKGNFIAKI